MTDIVRRAYGVDGVIINGGCLKADRVIAAGAITTKDVLDMMPQNDPVVVVKLKGSSIAKILEHSLNGLTAKFPQISGLRMVYDDEAKEGDAKIQQIWISRYNKTESKSLQKSYCKLMATESAMDDDDDDRESVLEPIEPDSIYSIATRHFLFCGGMGFEWFRNEAVEVVVDDENGVSIQVLMRNFFWAISAINDLLKMGAAQKEMERAASMMERFSLSPSPRKRSSLIHSVDIDLDTAFDIDGANGPDPESKEEAEQYHEALVVAPMLEHRIMTVSEHLQVIEAESMDQFGAMDEFMERLPSFAKMERMPRQQSLLMILEDVHGATPEPMENVQECEDIQDNESE